MSKLSEIEARDAIDRGDNQSHRDRRYLLGLMRFTIDKVTELHRDLQGALPVTAYVKEELRALLARLEE